MKTITLVALLLLSPKVFAGAVTEASAHAFLVNILTLGEGPLTNSLITRPLNASTASGNTLNQTVAINSTTFWPLFGGAAATNLTSDVSTGTRNLVTLPTVLTNLYFYSSASPGSGKTTTFTILTNGVSTGMTCALTATAKATNNTSSVTVLAGVEVGVSIATAASSTAVKYSWAVNLLQ